MSESKHTPGPWKASDLGLGPRGKTLGICISGPTGLPLFFVPRGKPQHEANARLISAAPDLLEALKEVVSISDRKHDAWTKAHAAIAKAEGR